jgi:hypothetical protein
LFRRHSLISDGELRWLLEVEKVVSPHGLVRECSAGGDDRGDTSPRRLHPAHPDAQQVLPAVSALSGQVRWLNPSASQKLFQSCAHDNRLSIMANV